MHSNQTNLYSKFIRYVHTRENSNFPITAYANPVQPHQHIPPYVLYVRVGIWAGKNSVASCSWSVRCSDLAYDDHSNFMQEIFRTNGVLLCIRASRYVLFAHSACTIHMPPIYFHEISLLNITKYNLTTKSEVSFVFFIDEADSGDDHSDRGRSHTPEQPNHHQEERPLALNLVSLSFLNILFE